MVNSVVTLQRRDDIGLIVIDNPPVNALGARLRAELHEALATVRDDASLRGVVIACAGRTFVAGADIGELGTPKQTQKPQLPELCSLIEALGKPAAAAIHGTALGGGLELALSCHYRVADRQAKLGLPEVKLGLIPGAGGTVRLPRLTGPEYALKMVVSGTPVSAGEALAVGLVDAVVEGDIASAAIEFLRDRLKDNVAPVREREEKLAPQRSDLTSFDALAAKLTAKTKGLRAPRAAADAIRNAIVLPFDEALAGERAMFLELSAAPESKALRHLFFAEREAGKIPGLDVGTKPRDIARVGVIGAGTMGGGIAMALANAGIDVTLLDATDAALERGMAMIERNYAASVSRGSLLDQQKAARLAKLTRSTDYASLAGCDLVIEAVFEDMAVKKEVVAKVDAVAKPGAIFATNTSYLDVDEIAQSSDRPQDVVGLHFFSPANVMKLLEVVRGRDTDPQVLATAISLGRRMGKVPVVVGVCRGFVGNRMLVARGAENENLLLEGATPSQVDAVFRAFGWPMGPFEMGDLAGLDISWRNRKAQGKTAILADTLCERGQFGQKTGGGWYRYEPGSRSALENPAAMALITQTAASLNVARRAISDQEIIERTLYPMINEGATILQEGIAARASDIDLVWVNGYGFPVALGGPMYWAREVEGLDKIHDRLAYWFERTGRPIFEPSSALLG